MHDGKSNETFIHGLYFEHIFNAGLFLTLIIVFASVFRMTSVVVFGYWWKTAGDLVGSSNIAAYILGFAAFWLAVEAVIPR
jgi:hypothetical protein